MAVCYFNEDYDKKYNCIFEQKNDGIEIVVDYDIVKEIQPKDGIISFGANTKFENRDILIIDQRTKMNYILKDAICYGYSEAWGTPDGGTKTKFFSRYYFYNNDYEKLCRIGENDNITSIKMYSNLINELIGYPSLSIEKKEEYYAIMLNRKNKKEKIDINENNVKSISLSDYWNSKFERSNSEITINFNGYIEIELINPIKYTEVTEYITELMIYLQLLKPNKLEINKIEVKINDIYYGINIPIKKIEKIDSNVIKNTVLDKPIDFISKCYHLIPYRNSKDEIFNIPYIILYSNRDLEDNFLMYYRFIECFYKRTQIKEIENNFIKYGIENNYLKNGNINNKQIEKNPIEIELEADEEKIDDLVAEIVTLRNHYVHDGYYIKNEQLNITYPKINKKPNPKNHIVSKVDFNWIYDRTEILYKIVIDIIFKNMLGYDEYTM